MGVEKDKLLIFLVVLSIAFFLASWLVANVKIGGAVTWVSAVFIMALAGPSYYFLIKWLGLRRGFLTIVVFSVLPIIIESIGILTEWPYGGFYYTDEMGVKIFGLVPWSVSFAFAPLVFGTFTLARRFSSNVKVVLPLSALFLVIIDLVLDPAAVSLNIWAWEDPGLYYGIPFSNYTGWFATALLSSLIFLVVSKLDWREVQEVPVPIMSSLLLNTSFWTGYSLWSSLYIPFFIGCSMMLLMTYFFFKRNREVK